MNKQNAVALAQGARLVIPPAPGDGTTLEERLQVVLSTEPSLAARYFAAYVICGVVEDELDEALLGALGVDYNEPNAWPCENITYDYYDSSFELKGTREDWEPSIDALAKVWALGFMQCWICYGGKKYGPDADPGYHEKYFAAPPRGATPV